MSLLLCSATRFEIAPTLDFLHQEGLEIEVLVTGVGLTAASCHLARALALRPPTLVLQAGVAGLLDPSLPLASTVLVESEFIGDEGVEEASGFRSLEGLGLLAPDQPPYRNGVLPNPHPRLHQLSLPVVPGVTVNEISTRPGRIEAYRRRGAVTESLEGAALHYAAGLANIPFLQLRSFSNFAGERNKERWQLAAAIGQLNHHLQQLIKTLTP